MKKILVIINLLIVALFYSQNLTPSENYIYSRTYLQAVTTENPNARQVQSVQYLDGLGRTKQSIAIKASPTGKDIVVPSVYDTDGKQTKSYLPIPLDSQNGAFLSNATENAINSYYGVPNAYAEVKPEKSPLARPEKAAAPGTEWQISGNSTQKISYLTNETGVVKKIKAVTTWNPTNQINDVSIVLAADDSYTTAGYYNANTLLKTVTTDEDGNQTHSYTNGSKQNILLRKINKRPNGSSENIDTYYVYDEFGNLSFVIPPKAAVFNNISELQANLDLLCYQYKYDKYNRLVEKKIPGKGWEYFVYDKQNRLILSQDALLTTTTNNFGKKGWMFSKYDALGRVVYTGFFANTATRAAMQNALNSMSANAMNNETTATTPFTQGSMNVYYTKNAFPTGSMTVLSVNYYDQYPTEAPPQPEQILNQSTMKATPTAFTTNGVSSVRSTQNMPTASYVKNIEDDNWTKSYSYYDTLGRVIGTYSINHLGGYTKTESELDFSGLAKVTKAYHKRLDADTEKVITQTFTYDNQNRLLTHTHQIDNNPVEYLAQNEYNELSQLKTKKVGGTNPASPLQSIDYTYNIRGWLTKINDPSNLNGKLFGYEMRYTNPVNTNIASGKFGGNISEIDWKNANEDVLKRYTYAYDGLNRLQDAIYSEPNSTTPFNNNFNENITYDVNGNIATLKRNAFPIYGTTSTLVDDLVYQYSGNTLTKVIENSLNDTGYEGGNNIISYDDNGNMKDMLDKGIQSINYNFLNLANQLAITQVNPIGLTSSSNINYLYRADGTKLRKTYTNTPPRGMMNTTMTDYLDGFQYEYLEDGAICITCRTESAFEQQAYSSRIAFPGTGTPEWKLDFVATAEGFYSFKENRYIYQYKDHLGNARVSFAKNSEDVLEIVNTNNYYPFGLNHIGGSNASSFGSFYSYKYNGKELQETGMLDYGWRQYMPDLARWNAIDQLAEKYHSTSPFAYVVNNPISLVDPDGMQIEETSTGWTFTGNDINLLHSYLTSGTNMGSNYNNLMQQLDSFGFSSGSGGGGISSFWSSFNGGNAFGGVSVGNNGTLSWWTNGANASGNNIQGLDGHMMNLRNDGNSSGAVGQPGEWESLIPIWGSGRAAVDHFQNGNYWRGAGYTALAISDVFMVKSLATGLGRGAWKLGSHSWSATRKWMMKKGYAGAGEPLHHWAITQATAKKYGIQSVTNQPWNLLKFPNQSLHMRAGHGMNYLGQPGYNALGQFWYGTPTWFKAGAFSTVGHGVQFGSYQFGPEDY